MPRQIFTLNASSNDDQDSYILREDILKLLDKVYFSLKETEEIKESIVIVRPSKDAISSVFDSLKSATNTNIPHEADILLPKKFIFDNKIFWECSKIKLNTLSKDSILQVLVNLFFIKNLNKITDKLKFIIAIPKDVIISTGESFTESIGDFIKIFPEEERSKLQNIVTFVVTDCNQDNVFESFEQLKRIVSNNQVKNFPTLLKNFKYLHNLDINHNNTVPCLRLDHIINMSGAKDIKLNNLNSFLTNDSNRERTLITDLYTEIEPKVCKIYETIKEIFVIGNFNIYKPFYYSRFTKISEIKNSPNLPFAPKPLQESSSCFKGLQQLFELKTTLEAENANTDLLSKGLKILGIIKKFTSNTQDIKTYYWLDRQIEELLFFQEAANQSNSNFYKAAIEKVQSFIKDTFPSSIKNIDLKPQEPIQYYQEAITWLNQYNKPEEIAETKATCYLNIAKIHCNNKNYEEALANYHFALKYNDTLKEIYSKIADMLSELGYKELAIEYYKIENKLPEILKCFESIVKADPKNKEIYIKKGDYLLSQEYYEDAAYNYHLAYGLASDPCEKQNILGQQIGAAMQVPSNEIQPTEITFEAREEHGEYDISGIIGNCQEILN